VIFITVSPVKIREIGHRFSSAVNQDIEMKDLFSLQGKRILITGAGQGLVLSWLRVWRNMAQKSLLMTFLPRGGRCGDEITR
jgi:hypothetical protein